MPQTPSPKRCAISRWLYRQLEREYDYQTSDAFVDETIAVNGWTFTAAGQPFG